MVYLTAIKTLFGVGQIVAAVGIEFAVEDVRLRIGNADFGGKNGVSAH